MRKALLTFSFFPLSACTLILLSFLTLTFELHKATYVQIMPQNVKSFENAMEIVLTNIPKTNDSKSQILTVKRFLTTYGSPLVDYSDYIVEVSNTYGIDFRLIPAIAMQESNLCKKAPSDSYNCWGYGIYGGKVRHFSNFKEGIETVAFSLSQDYVKKGYTTVDQIMSKYTPNNTNDWSTAVSHFMAQMEKISSSF